MKIENPLLLSNHLCFSIYACSREFTKLYTPYLKKFNLTYPQYLVMLALWENGTLSIKQLGQALYLDSGTLTPMLKRLEEAQMVTRKRSEDDERRVLVSLTDKGADLQKEVSTVPHQIFEKTGLTPKQFEEHNRSIKILLHQLRQSS
ncbi:MarR family transcriptional regulator [Hazenella sp. IB182357]|uniref:MarR family transcriptional regulator n=1 Tax=Polycladospora coralii TaxID=2771432 RepID=A0A926N9I8_9BACL|nr:MarR family transcriptional regulator [Polycladospora coralii]MBD1370985.1 MarR family transcriptional regulator [Polycladospora coralii]MBS7529924.1 MarR family transcriptional regulator [Polycladospora coralii]